MQVINMTPYVISILNSDSMVITKLKPSGNTVRLVSTTSRMDVVYSGNIPIPLTATVFGEPEGLPNTVAGIVYIVDASVKDKYPERDDLVTPNEPVRNRLGNIIGYCSLRI